MIRIELDSLGSLAIRWPVSNDKTLQLGNAFVTYESTLPVDQQSPLLPLIRSALTTGSSSASQAGSGETTRAVSAEELRQARADAKAPLKQAYDALKLQYSENLAVLEDYGLETKQGPKGVVVYAPHNQQAWDNLLVAYVAKQGGLEGAQQILKPALSTLEPLSATVSSSRKNRDDGRTQREMSVSSRLGAAAQLHDLLEVAACHPIVTRFGFKLPKDLKQWGYDVV